MKFKISFEQVYPHPPQKVWQALIDSAALGEWLMSNDFSPEVDRDFKMWCDDGAGGTEAYFCKVLEYEPPTRMLWSWVAEGSRGLGETLVEFRVERANGGARVTITHSGDRDAETVARFEGGWPAKLETLGAVLSEAPKI